MPPSVVMNALLDSSALAVPDLRPHVLQVPLVLSRNWLLKPTVLSALLARTTICVVSELASLVELLPLRHPLTQVCVRAWERIGFSSQQMARACANLASYFSMKTSVRTTGILRCLAFRSPIQTVLSARQGMLMAIAWKRHLARGRVLRVGLSTQVQGSVIATTLRM